MNSTLGAIDPAEMAATVKVIAAARTFNRLATLEEMWSAGFVE
jgi:hypothetical protein